MVQHPDARFAEEQPTDEIIAFPPLAELLGGVRSRRVQKHKRVAKPLMVALFMIMIDELGDSPARGS